MDAPEPDAPPPGGYGAPALSPESHGPHGFGPAPAPAPPTGSSGRARALVVLAVALTVLLGVVGTLGVLGYLGMRKFTLSAKTAEARNNLGAIAKDAVMAYESPADLESGSPADRVCPSASRPVPLLPSMIKGRKYPSTPEDWEVDKPRNAGFACLRFSMQMAQYYQYRYEATPSSFLAGARGDLDADGQLSDFTLRGEVKGGMLVLDPRIAVTDPEE